MSDILLSSAALKPQIERHLPLLSQQADLSIPNKNFIMLCFGLKENMLLRQNESGEQGHFCTGVPLIKQYGRIRRLHEKDLSLNRHKSTEELQGHFLQFRWDEENIFLQNDKLGIRYFFYAQTKSNEFILSTRSDWMVAILGKCELNRDAFAFRWFSLNPPKNYNPFLNFLKSRMGERLHFNFISKSLNVTKKASDSDFFSFEKNGKKENYYRSLAEFCNPDLHAYRLGIGLSGGIDSRIITSLVGTENAFCFSHGEDSHPDVKMASKIAKESGLEFEHFPLKAISVKERESDVFDYVASTLGTAACSSASLKSVLKSLTEKRIFFIDGGMGEIHRRQYLFKLEAKLGLPWSPDLDANLLFKTLRTKPPSFFSAAFTEDWESKAKSGMSEYFYSLTLPTVIKTGDKLDFISFQLRVQNIASSHQAFYDRYSFHYMPFLQPEILERMFRLKLKERKNGHFLLKKLKQSDLQTHTWVKDGKVYSFAKPGSALMRLMLSFKKRLKDEMTQNFLEQNRELVLDTVHSSEVGNSSVFDQDDLLRKAGLFYDRGEEVHSNYIESFLTQYIWFKQHGLLI